MKLLSFATDFVNAPGSISSPGQSTILSVGADGFFSACGFKDANKENLGGPLQEDIIDGAGN
jgi:hypothetical protein